MRILYHHRTQGEEPESVHIANIVAALRNLGHTVDIVGPAPVGSSKKIQSASFLARLKTRMPRGLLELAMLAYNLRSLLQLACALRANDYDFIYERYALNNFSGLAAARMFRIPIVLEVNTPYAQAWSKYYGLAFASLARTIERWIFRRVDSLITVTEVQRRGLEREGVRPERIYVSHNAIDPAEFDPGIDSAVNLRAGLKQNALIAGFVGTMNRWQGVKGFADVIERVAARGAEVRFVFVGDGEGRAPLEAQLNARGLQRFAKFLGRQPHAAIPSLVSQFDIGLLLDSNAYGSPMKVFEYWAMSKAVIAPAVDPVLEILEPGETGILIEPGSAVQMSEAILKLAGDSALRMQLGSAGRRHVLATHTWTQNAETIIKAVQSIGAVPGLAQREAG